MNNFFPHGAPMIRSGYRGFLSAVLMLWRMNRNARKLNIKTKAEFIIGFPWFK